MFRHPSTARHDEPGSVYCRHDNQLVDACPRAGCLESCPLRHECPAVQPGARADGDRRLVGR